MAELRPRLRQHISLQRHEYRGEPWYVLHDTLNGQVHRFTPQAYQIIGRLDGMRTVRQIWDDACESLADEMPTQHDVVALIGRLHHANLLAGEGEINIDELMHRQRQQRQQKWLQMLRSPLGIRIPLMDPERLVAASYPWVRPFISRLGMLIWLLVVITAVVLAGLHWPALSENVTDRVLAIDNLLMLLLLYPLIKALHELGHAWATHDAGGEVHEIGVMLLVFIPVPYVDASSAAACPDKYQRMLVGGAGMLVEVFLAAVAMLVWVMAEPGLVRAVAFNIMLIAGVSTLLFNGNPLLRFDGYYILSDWLEIPNLAQRANQQLAYVLKRHLLRQAEAIPVAQSRSESAWLVGYALSSFVYRMMIMVAVAVFVATRYFFIGVLLAIWSLSMTLVMPALKVLRSLQFDASMDTVRTRAWLWLGGSLTGLLVFLLLIPMPYATHFYGVIEPGEPAQIRTGVTGELLERYVTPGQRVHQGELLWRLAVPELEAELAILYAQQREIAQQLAASVRDASALAILAETQRFIEQRIVEAESQAQAMLVRSPREGVLLYPQGEPIPGAHIERGRAVAVVMRSDELRIRAMVPEHHGDRVRADLRKASVRVNGASATHQAELRAISPVSGHEVVHAALTRDAGGDVIVDPRAAESNLALHRYYQADFVAADLFQERSLLPGQRLSILVRHSPEPLAYRAWRAVRRSFLRLFEK